MAPRRPVSSALPERDAGAGGAGPGADRVQESSEESFPASDAPSWQPLRVGTPRPRSQEPPPDSPTSTVQRLFAAFGAGDLDALVETVHPDSQWTYYGANPRLSQAEFSGRAGVRRFFEGILRRLEVTEFNADAFVAEGETVVVFGSEAGTVRATGAPFRNAWAQRYVVREGQIVAMAEYNVQVQPGL